MLGREIDINDRLFFEVLLLSLIEYQLGSEYYFLVKDYKIVFGFGLALGLD